MARKKKNEIQQEDEALVEPQEQQEPNNEIEAAEEDTTTESEETHSAPANPPKKKRFHWRPTKKQAIIVGAVVAVVLVLGLVPPTRNTIFGIVFKTNMSVEVYDEIELGNGQKGRVQLSDVTIKVDGQEKVKGATSPVLLTKLRPGKHTVSISKANYKSLDQKVTANLAIGKQRNTLSSKMDATGIPTKYTVVNYVTGEPVKGAQLVVGESKATTDDNGLALVVLPIQKDRKYKISLSGEGYLDQTIDVELGKQDSIAIVPAGRVYFLSKESGKIDVVKTNIDGSDRKVVLAGSGKEIDSTTTMISTTDWKYLALSTRRADKKNQLILINTSNDSQVTFDEGNANFTLYGWEGKKLVYTTTNEDLQQWNSGRQKLKIYDADQNKINVVYQNTASGSNAYDAQYESLDTISIVNKQVLYQVSAYRSSEERTIRSTNISSGVTKTLFKTTNSEFGYLELNYTSAHEAYFSGYNYPSQKTKYFEVNEAGNWESLEKFPDKTDQYTYFVSPDGNKLLWSEERDGKQTVLLGDSEANNAKKLYALSELKPYAWLTNEYALYSKKDSELYIAPLKENGTPKKIADYHRPSAVTFRGYGGGGGGPY